MTPRTLLLPLAATAALGLAACGDDGKDGDAAAKQATPAQAVAEIGEVRTLLDQAVASLRSGDRKAAEEQVTNAYLEHFEHVEGPLEKVDGHLNEELEESISTELRNKVKAGVSAAELSKLVAEVKRDLATAETKLK